MNLADKFKQFAAKIENEPIDYNGRVLIVDGLNTYLRAFAATPTMNDDGDHMGGISGFLLSLGAAIRFHHPTRVVIVFDGKGGSAKRRQLFPDYKENRRNMTKLNRTYDFGTIEREQESQKWQLLKLIEMLRCLPLVVMAPDNVEADDAIAYLAQTAEERGGKAIILSTDKDFLQLVNENISVWNPVKKKLYVPTNVVEDYGFHPHNFLLYRAVTGDTSDCIPGVEGIKEKTLLKYFPEFAQPEKKTVEEMFASTQKLIDDAKKPAKALLTLMESKDVVERNIMLMRLDDVAMSGGVRLQILEKFDAPLQELKKFDLTKLVLNCKLMNAFGRWDEWVQRTFIPLLRFNIKVE